MGGLWGLNGWFVVFEWVVCGVSMGGLWGLNGWFVGFEWVVCGV